MNLNWFLAEQRISARAAFSALTRGAWPGVGSADAIVDRNGRLRKIELAVLFFQHRAFCGLRFILRGSNKRARFQRDQRFTQRLRAEDCHARKELARCLVGIDGDAIDEQDSARVHADIGHHGRNAGPGFAVDNRPLDRRRAAILGQK